LHEIASSEESVLGWDMNQIFFRSDSAELTHSVRKLNLLSEIGMDDLHVLSLIYFPRILYF
jgi:hypothetical protein